MSDRDRLLEDLIVSAGLIAVEAMNDLEDEKRGRVEEWVAAFDRLHRRLPSPGNGYR